MSVMHLYGGSVADAAQKVVQPKFIADCEKRFAELFGAAPSPEEVRSWTRSWPALLSVLTAAGLDGFHIVLEYCLPATGERVDALLLGEDYSGHLVAVAVELKQWTSVRTDPRRPGLVLAGQRVVQHPARQVGGYVRYLEDWIAQDQLPLLARGVVVLHDAGPDLVDELRALAANGPSATFPVLGRDDLDATQPPHILAQQLACAGLKSPSEEAIAALLAARHRPSRGLLARAGQVIEGHDTFRLIGDQDKARQTVLHTATAARERRTKGIVVVTGGPGTGKSVIACRLLGDLCRIPNANPRLLSPSGTLTRQLKRTVGDDSRGLIATFAGRVPSGISSDSVVLIDEAHRARTGFTGQRDRFPIILGNLIDRAAVTVLFLDERQIIRPDEGISLTELKAHADKNGYAFEDIDLTTQFRCNGSQAYHQWIDQLLQPTGTAPTWTGTDYDLSLAANPDEFTHWIETHTRDGLTARITAGFCWPWETPSTPPLLPEVAIHWDSPDGPLTWARPWNYREDDTPFDTPDLPGRPFWATDTGGHQQVGCVYTAQGMEYSHNTVIIGNDLVRRNNRWIAQPAESHDSKLNRLPPEQYLRYALNTYRVLATRGTKGTRLYSTDPTTQAYLQDLLPPHAQ